MNFKKLYIDKVEGNLYTRSFKLGKIYKEDIQRNCKNISHLLNDTKINDILNIVKSKLEKLYPEYVQEVYGKADGAEVDRYSYLLYICYEIYTERERCTDVIIKLNNNKIIGGHNEDGPYSLNNTGLIKYITNYGYFCEYYCNDALPGSTFSWNSHGLIFTCNYIYIKNKNQYGIPTWFILRNLIECKSIEEVLEKLNIEDAASGCNVNIIDTNTKRAYSIEWRLNNLDILEITDKFAHSNHLTRKEVGLSIAENDSNSKFRLEKSKELLNKIKINNKEDILKILQFHTEDFKSSIRNMIIEDDNSITAATFIYNTDRELIIHSYLDNQIYAIDYDMKNILP